MHANLFLSAALAAALALPATAMAQQQSGPSGASKQSSEQRAAADANKDAAKKADPKAAAAGIKPDAKGTQSSDIIGKSAVGANGEEIGDIKELLIDQKGQVTAAIVDVGGFLGIGSKQVAIDYTKLKADPQNDRFTLSMTKEQLQQAPEFQQSADAGAANRDPQSSDARQRERTNAGSMREPQQQNR